LTRPAAQPPERRQPLAERARAKPARSSTRDPLTRSAPSTAEGRAEVNPMRLVREPSYDTE